MSIFGSIGGLVGGLFGAEDKRKQASQNAVAPGIGVGSAHDASTLANKNSIDALNQYLASMGGVQGQANQYGSDLRSIFQHYAGAMNQGQQQLAGQAARATGQVAGVYKNYGQQAEGVARQNYGNLLNNITDDRAIARARGGNNSGQDMLAAGQRAMATQGLNSNLSDIASQRAQLYGGALQSGLNTQLGVGQAGQQMQQSLLNDQMGMRTAAFQIPAQYAQQTANTALQQRNSPQQLYPDTNAWNFLSGFGRYNPNNNNVNGPGQVAGGMGGDIGNILGSILGF